MPINPMPTPSPKMAVTIGKPHRQHRAEGDQQDDHCSEQAEQLTLGEADRLEDLTAVLDGQIGDVDLVAERLDVVGEQP